MCIIRIKKLSHIIAASQYRRVGYIQLPTCLHSLLWSQEPQISAMGCWQRERPHSRERKMRAVMNGRTDVGESKLCRYAGRKDAYNLALDIIPLHCSMLLTGLMLRLWTLGGCTAAVCRDEGISSGILYIGMGYGEL